VGLWIAAHIGWYRYYPPAKTAFTAGRMAGRAKAKLTLRYRWVPYMDIGEPQAGGDRAGCGIRGHGGFDWDGIRARSRKIEEGSRRRQRRRSRNAPQRIFLARQELLAQGRRSGSHGSAQSGTSQTGILELYLNVIEWGNGVFGAEAAAQRYFGVTAAELSAEQSARLAAMAPSPRAFERRPDSSYIAGRLSTILARMPAATIP
jgi:monofunctional biosynthetic peptidoglycan transglycosylase